MRGNKAFNRRCNWKSDKFNTKSVKHTCSHLVNHSRATELWMSLHKTQGAKPTNHHSSIIPIMQTFLFLLEFFVMWMRITFRKQALEDGWMLNRSLTREMLLWLTTQPRCSEHHQTLPLLWKCKGAQLSAAARDPGSTSRWCSGSRQVSKKNQLLWIEIWQAPRRKYLQDRYHGNIINYAFLQRKIKRH